MNHEEQAWQDEINRRAGLYNDIAERDGWQGRMTGADYLVLLALVVVLVVGFWTWGN